MPLHVLLLSVLGFAGRYVGGAGVYRGAPSQTRPDRAAERSMADPVWQGAQVTLLSLYACSGWDRGANHMTLVTALISGITNPLLYGWLKLPHTPADFLLLGGTQSIPTSAL